MCCTQQVSARRIVKILALGHMEDVLVADVETIGTGHLKPTATMPLSDGMRQFKKRTHFLSVHRPELTCKYPDQWVGLACNWTLIAAPTLDDMLSKMEAIGITREGLAVKLMATKPRRMIL